MSLIEKRRVEECLTDYFGKYCSVSPVRAWERGLDEVHYGNSHTVPRARVAPRSLGIPRDPASHLPRRVTPPPRHHATTACRSCAIAAVSPPGDPWVDLVSF